MSDDKKRERRVDELMHGLKEISDDLARKGHTVDVLRHKTREEMTWLRALRNVEEEAAESTIH